MHNFKTLLVESGRRARSFLPSIYHVLIAILPVFMLAFMLPPSTAFTPPASSPLSKGEHPRILFTADELQDLRGKIENYYVDEFQSFIDVANQQFGKPLPDDSRYLLADVRNFAFLCAINPATIGGISTGGHSREDYCNRAKELALHAAEKSWVPSDHNCANSLDTKGCGLPGLALAAAYDWLYDRLSASEKEKIVDSLWNYYQSAEEIVPPYGDGEKIKRENHVAAEADAFAGGFAFWGDYSGENQDRADAILNAFEEVVVRRVFGVGEKKNPRSANWVEGSTSYSGQGWGGFSRTSAIAKHALGTDYFSKYSDMAYLALYPYFNLMPLAPDGKYYFAYLKTSSNGRTGRIDEGHAYYLHIFANERLATDRNLAGFAAWLVDKSPYQYHFPKDEEGIRLYSLLFSFIWGVKDIPKYTPDSASIPLIYNTGEDVTIRSSHDADRSTRIQIWSTEYFYPNGHNKEDMGAFYLEKYGTLVVRQVNVKSGLPRASIVGPIHHNVFSVYDPSETEDGYNLLSFYRKSPGGRGDIPEDYYEGSPLQVGKLRALDDTSDFTYLDYDYTDSYAKRPDKVSFARRQYLYLKGGDNQEYLILYDHIKSDLEKRFVINTPFEIESLDASWKPTGTDGVYSSTSRRFKTENNWKKAHGVLYVTSLLPASVEARKFGRDGCEWMDADGKCIPYGRTFDDEAKYLVGSRRLDLISKQSPFLTVLQFGDSNTLTQPSTASYVQGSSMDGVILGDTVVMFSPSTQPASTLSYEVSHSGSMRHIITGMQPSTTYDVFIGNQKKSITSDAYGVLSFTDDADGTRSIQIGNGISRKCSDGTYYGRCSSDAPFYCDEGELVENCAECGCPQGYECSGGISCEEAGSGTGESSGNGGGSNPPQNDSSYGGGSSSGTGSSAGGSGNNDAGGSGSGGTGSQPPADTGKGMDVNHDGKVDVKDIYYCANYLGTGFSECDINSDGKVNLIDMSLIARDAKPGCIPSPEVCGNGIDDDCDGIADSDDDSCSETSNMQFIQVEASRDAPTIASVPTRNYGFKNKLWIRADDYVSYISFDVPPISHQIAKAELWLYAVDDARHGGNLYFVPDNSWSEDTITFDNRPSLGTPIATHENPIRKKEWVSFDVSSVVRSSGTYSFALKSPMRSKGAYSSKEGEAPPTLKIFYR